MVINFGMLTDTCTRLFSNKLQWNSMDIFTIFSLFVIICYMASQHERTFFSNSLFSCFLLPTLRVRNFPIFYAQYAK